MASDGIDVNSPSLGFLSSDILKEGIRPFLMTSYIWDAFVNGKVLEPKTYDISVLTFWVNTTLEKLFNGMPFPRHLDKESTIRRIRNEVIKELSSCDLEKFIKKVDPQEIEAFINKMQVEGEAQFGKFIEFFRNEEFPPILWMELQRFKDVYLEASLFLMERIGAFFRRYKKSSARLRKPRISRIFRELIYSFFNSIFNFIRVLFFVEIWSSKDMEDLFKKEKKLSLKSVDEAALEAVIIPFHDSTNQLIMALYKFNKKAAKSDFTDPVGWALKQLVYQAGT